MRAVAAVALTAMLLSACVPNPVPEGYTGPRAKIQDTFTQRSERAVDMFFLDKVDGKSVENALRVTTSANYGRGFAMDAAGYQREAPAQQAAFTITGRTHYAAPILELTNPVYEATGTITFTPTPDHLYVVRGELKEGYAGVWLEDAATKTIVGKIEQKGDAAEK